MELITRHVHAHNALEFKPPGAAKLLLPVNNQKNQLLSFSKKMGSLEPILRRLFCILLVALHLINLVGGYWIFYTLQQESRATLAAELDLDRYAGSDAILIKLPLADPVSDKEHYERVDGEFEYNGTVYRMVKQKFYKDTVYIVCYKDDRTIAVKDAFHDYAKSISDTPSGKKSEGKFDSQFIKDYLLQGKVSLIVNLSAINVVNHTVYRNGYNNQYDFAIDHPPQLIA